MFRRRCPNRAVPAPPDPNSQVVPSFPTHAAFEGLARRASGLGKEAAELHGLLGELAALGIEQPVTAKRVAIQIDSMRASNRSIRDGTGAAMHSVKQARGTVEEVARGVNRVNEALHQVVAVAEAITKISLQTRLVAFNASVEVGRAGEAGRGFAVVAEAVKELADKVESSAKLITSTVAMLGRDKRSSEHLFKWVRDDRDSRKLRHAVHEVQESVVRTPGRDATGL